MTGTSHPNLPQGYVQLTEGRIRTTDLVFGKSAGAWSAPHAFEVGSEVVENDMKVARRGAAQSKGGRTRS